MADRIVQNGVEIRELGGRVGADGVSSDSAERRFLCKGNTDPLICRQALLDQLFYDVRRYDGLVLDSLAYDVYAGSEAWEFTCTYANVPEVGSYTVAIDTSGGLVKVTDAFAQTAYPAAGQTAPNYGTSISVQDGQVLGVDRIIPALKITITSKIAEAYVSSPIAYAKLVASVTGGTNDATFLTFSKGELLFTGATGNIIEDKEPTLQYTFLASPNLTNASIGPISGITKAGHDYIWFSYKDQKDASTQVTLPTARAAYVSRVYGEFDFTVLKIGET